MSTAGLTAALLQVGLTVAGAPVLVGLMRRVRARLEGRTGPSIWQPWRDLRKLARKERIAPEYTSWVFATAPVATAAIALVVAAIIPLATTRSGLNGAGDLFAIAFLLLAGTVILALAGLDAGSAFGGMGASRAMTISALAEPALLLATLARSIPAGSTSLAAVVAATLRQPGSIAAPQTMLAMGALAVVTLAETGRLPVDNPASHLELTMIHEAMVLEYAGSDLALLELASHMRLVAFMALLANLFVPWGIATGGAPWEVLRGVVAAVGKIGALGVGLATFEVFTAKLRLFRVPELLGASFLLAFLAITSSFWL
jgi:formate hydrogenlyase subunit 4